VPETTLRVTGELLALRGPSDPTDIADLFRGSIICLLPRLYRDVMSDIVGLVSRTKNGLSC